VIGAAIAIKARNLVGVATAPEPAPHTEPVSA